MRCVVKRIAFFCDGTWNRSDARNPTSVVQLAQMVRPTASDGVAQQVFYLPGVGTGRGSTRVARTLDRIGGGAFGWGLTENIQDAFRNLVFCFEPGDEIFIFGFSRGAYTARSLAGLIRSSGIPERSQIAAIPAAIKRYRARGPDSHPDTDQSREFRAIFSPRLSTNMAEIDWRRDRGYPDSQLLTVTYLGVWDTVGALGLPGVLGSVARVVNRKYQFHDAALSSSVRGARHALALDEKRKLYPPTIWDNLDRLNGEATGAERPYQQLWFPGNHGVVGGSGPVPGLSAGALQWIARGAEARGLELDPALAQANAARIDPAAQNAPLPQTAGLANLGGMLLKDRDGPDQPGDVAPLTAQRVAQVPTYRPPSLKKVIDLL